MKIKGATAAGFIAIFLSLMMLNTMNFVNSSSSQVSEAPSNPTEEGKQNNEGTEGEKEQGNTSKDAPVSAHETLHTNGTDASQAKTRQIPSEGNPTTSSFIRSTKAEDITSDCIIQHNKYRVGHLKHPVMPAERNSEAVYQALSYAKKLVETGCSFKHSGAKGFGENLFMIGLPTSSCQAAVDTWYREIRLFNGVYPGGNRDMDTGHFTQLMWSTSTGIGCARTVGCENGSTIVVCNYKPPGNRSGEAPFSEEVWESLMEASAFSPSSSFALFVAAVGLIFSWGLVWH